MLRVLLRVLLLPLLLLFLELPPELLRTPLRGLLPLPLEYVPLPEFLP